MEKKEFSDISDLIFKKFSETASEEEIEELQRWIDYSEHNRELYDQITSEETISSHIKIYQESNLQEAFDSFLRKRLYLERRRHISRLVIRYAAILALPLAVALLYFVGKPSVGHIETVQQMPDSSENRPVLTFSDGEKMILSSGNLEWREKDGTKIEMNEQSGIRYSASDSVNDRTIYNTLEVPKQCDYSFVLSDGTKVWLNAVSSIRYPVAFPKNERVVYADGEIYLEVAKDATRPFYVVLNNGMKVKVLGTSFNVNTYQNVQVTLATGRIQVEGMGHRRWNLTPGMQLTVDNGEGVINKVNVEDFLAWRYGMFVFHEKKLEDIAQALERWYDIKVFFLNERVKNELFTGVLDKNIGLEKFLKQLFHTSRINFVLSGNQLFVK